MIYLDNAATTRPDRNSVAKAERFLFEEFYNPSGLYREGFTVQQELKKSKKHIVSMIADPMKYSLIFTSCGTEADNQAIFTFAKRGNAVTTSGEHSAVNASFIALKNNFGIETRFASLNSDGSVNVDDLLSKIDGSTTFVSVIHVNNETGAINDVNSIAKKVKAKAPKVIFHSDGVQAFGKIPFKIGQEIDLYSVSAHKIGGLKGMGGLFYKKSLNMKPYIYGGGQEDGLRSGTENMFSIKVFENAAEEKYSKIQENFEYINNIKKRLYSLLDKTYFCAFSEDFSKNTPYILTLKANNLRGEILLHMANDQGLIIGTGSACSSNSKNRYSRVIISCGTDEKTADGIIRISFSRETTEDEIIAASDILNRTAKLLTEKMS